MLKKMIKTVALCMLAGAGSAQAAIVHLAGSTVDFYYDDAQPGMAAYGTLMAVGDSIFVSPSDFLAESVNGGSDTFSAFGTVTIVAKTGYQFESATVVQQGDYQLNGAGAMVDVVGDLSVVDSFNAATNNMLVTTNTGLGVNDGSLNTWSSSGQFDLTAPIWTSVTSIDLSLLSTLTATTGGLGEQAFIQNKLIGSGLVTIETSAIPVPAAVWLFGSGLLGFVAMARRQRS